MTRKSARITGIIIAVLVVVAAALIVPNVVRIPRETAPVDSYQLLDQATHRYRITFCLGSDEAKDLRTTVQETQDKVVISITYRPSSRARNAICRIAHTEVTLAAAIGSRTVTDGLGRQVLPQGA